MKYSIFFVAIASLLFSCKNEKTNDTDPKTAPFVELNFDQNNLQTHPGFHDFDDRGPIESLQLDECSGMAVSRSSPDKIWAHNDSGDHNRLFLLGKNGEDFGTIRLKNAGNRDWEDMCIGPGPEAGVNYLYVGEIGDNNAVHSVIRVYRYPEPDISNFTGKLSGWTENDADMFAYTYPDGPVDAETLMIDPWTKDLYIITKRGFKSIIYRAPYPQAEGPTVLEKVALLPFNWVLAGDISADGTLIAIKIEKKIFCWERIPGETVIQAMQREPRLLPYLIEPQGESFAWMPDNSGYFTLSEKKATVHPRLYYYGAK